MKCLRALVVVFSVLILPNSGCIVRASYSSTSCSCEPGYVCCETLETCLPEGVTCPSNPPDMGPDVKDHVGTDIESSDIGSEVVDAGQPLFCQHYAPNQTCGSTPSSCTILAEHSDSSCDIFCRTHGSKCLRAEGSLNGTCQVNGLINCNQDAPSLICTCSDTIDCHEKFTPGDYCKENGDNCIFMPALEGSSCQEYCRARGGECLGALEYLGSVCAAGIMLPCDITVMEVVCTCAMRCRTHGERPDLSHEDSDVARQCCSGLTLVDHMMTFDQDCTYLPVVNLLGICINCGDNVCDAQFESKCNCPQDCLPQ